MLALIADLYTPLFLAATLWIAYQNKRLINTLLFLLYSSAAILAVSAIDQIYTIWHTLALDFSTHTAVTLPLLWVLLHRPFSLWLTLQWADYFSLPLVRVGWLLLFLSYYVLMVWLNYHSVADILTTCLVIQPLLTLIAQRQLKR